MAYSSLAVQEGFGKSLINAREVSTGGHVRDGGDIGYLSEQVLRLVWVECLVRFLAPTLFL